MVPWLYLCPLQVEQQAPASGAPGGCEVRPSSWQEAAAGSGHSCSWAEAAGAGHSSWAQAARPGHVCPLQAAVQRHRQQLWQPQVREDATCFCLRSNVTCVQVWLGAVCVHGRGVRADAGQLQHQHRPPAAARREHRDGDHLGRRQY